MSSGDEYLSKEVEAGMTREVLLRRAAALGLAATALGPFTSRALAQTNIKRGGTFRLGVTGSSKDIIDGQMILVSADTARLMAGWDRLAYFDPQYQIKLELAEELTIEKADQYLIRVRDGVEFHNGKTLDIDDVIYSIRRTLNKKLGLFGQASLGSIDPNRMKKLDSRTVRLTLKHPDVTLLESFAQYYQGVVPVGYAPTSFRSGPLHAIGTGPFKLKSFTPGRQSVHVRNENYWRSGQPYFDQVVIIDFADDATKVNALLSGQIDAMNDVPAAQVPVIKQHSNLRFLRSPGGNWDPIVMAVNQGPFKDVRVRQAFKLLANRPQMVQESFSGYGRIGNDVPSPNDPLYAGHEFPQHTYDPEKAKALLQAAGQSGLSIELVTAPGDIGMVPGATVFAQNASAGGITVTVRDVDTGTLYGSNYQKWTFATDSWRTRNFLPQCAAGYLKSAFFNETHWSKSEHYARFQKLYLEGIAAVDVKRRKEIIREMSLMLYNEGGHIIWGFFDLLDGYSAKIGGFVPDKGPISLTTYGHGYRTIYFV